MFAVMPKKTGKGLFSGDSIRDWLRAVHLTEN
jgi:hypothetical protein